MCSWRFSPIPAILAGCYQPLGSFGSFFLGEIPGYSGRIDSDPPGRELVPVCPIGIRAGTFAAVLRAAPGKFFQPADQPSVESFDLCGASGFVKSDYGFFFLVCQAHAGFLLFAVKILHFPEFRACVSFRNETNCFCLVTPCGVWARQHHSRIILQGVPFPLSVAGVYLREVLGRADAA